MLTTRLHQNIMFLLMIISIAMMSVANAEPGKRDGKRRGPPPEAVEACANQSEGATCQFTGRRGEVQRTCITPPNGEQTLACAPQDGPPADEH